MTQVLEKAKIVHTSLPDVRVATSITTISAAGVTATTVGQIVNLAEPVYTAAGRSEEDRAVEALGLETFASDWESDADSIYDNFLEDADLWSELGS